MNITQLSVCPKCGKKLKEGARFCSSCGASITAHKRNPQLVKRKGFGVARADAFEYPVDYIHIISNGKFSGSFRLVADDVETQLTIHLMMPGINQYTSIKNATKIKTK